MSARTLARGPKAGKQVDTPAYLTAEEVAELLRCSLKSVYRIAKADPTLPMLKVGGLVRFPWERLVRWLRDREQGRPRISKQVHPARKSAPHKEAASA